ncbi:MAG: Npt1/Npt2 family nucleotide transporter [Vicinamibacterales bacterium]
MALVQRALRPIVELREEESTTALMMFGYSFLAMTAYNIVQPITRSRFISSLGSENLPYVLLVSAFIIGFLMQGYSRLGALLPGRWLIPVTQTAMVALLLTFWILFAAGQQWVDVGFYLFGQIYAVLLISQFWTLANLIYDPRQAKRLFGFIGGGASLGGAVGSSITAFMVEEVGTTQLVLVSAIVLAACAGLVILIIRRSSSVEIKGLESAGEEKGVGGSEALRMLRESRHLQVIALTIALMSIGAGFIDQQLSMASEAAKGRGATDAITAVLGRVQVYVSLLGFVIQVWLTSRIHRLLGVGFALLMLPFGHGASALIILLNGGLWTAMLARTMDKTVRYTVDKTTREILFLPLPAALKQRAKPFVDVTVDRFARAGSALLLLVLIKPWGFNFSWQQISWASLAVMVVWIVTAIRAKRGYVAAFRQSLEQRVMEPEKVTLGSIDLTTIETLVQELAHPDPARVVYAIDVLESLDKRNLVTPLLLYHESPAVRARALKALSAVRADIAERWAPHIRRMLADTDSEVRAGAITALSYISQQDAASLARPMLSDRDPRIRVTAAAALADSDTPQDADAAEATFVDIIANTSPETRNARRDVASAIRQIRDHRFRRLLVPLLYDPAPEVADEAMESVRSAGSGDFVFVPTLVALLRHRRLKGQARSVLVTYGEPVIDALAHFMRDPDEDIWVRRHIPATLALIPSQKSVDVLAAALAEGDGFLRYKVVAALERLRREASSLKFPRENIERFALSESRQYFNYLSLRHNLFGRRANQSPPAGSLLELALDQKLDRTLDRIFRLLALVYPWKDIRAARWTLQHADGRARAGALEYLDNLLTGQVRKQIMPVIEEMPLEEKVRRGNVLLKTRPRDVEETLLQLINDDDQVVAAAAIDVVRQQKMWTLGDDIEHVLAHRDVRDWYVFEAASWALAERRMPAERRRELWLEPLPAAELAGRLRRLPLFASLSVDELFRITGAGRQVRHEPGSVLLQEGVVPESIHLLLDGAVTATSRDGAPRKLEGTQALGFVEALSGTAMRDTLRTMDMAVTLVLSVEELRTLLSENTDLVVGLFATLAKREHEDPVHPTGAASELGALAAGGLAPVQKVLALQRVPIFSRVSADEIRPLADIAQVVTMETGAPLFSESAPAAVWLLLSGEVQLNSPAGDASVIARGGDVIGSIGAMAGQPLGRSATVTRGGFALRLDREDLFSLIAERPELLRQVFAGLFRNEAFVA